MTFQINWIHKRYQYLFLAGICMASFQTISDYIYFDLKTIQGHIYVSFIEIILQVFIYNIAISKTSQDGYASPSRSIAVFFLLNVLVAWYKVIFLEILASAQTGLDFSSLLPGIITKDFVFASVADGNADAIAYALYKCKMCVPPAFIPLNEPFIAYIFVAIAFTAGEFNQPVLWLTLETINFYASIILLKISNSFFPSIRYPFIIPVIYLLLFEIHGVTLVLFKDGIIVFGLICLFYIYLWIIKNENKAYYLEIAGAFLVALIYSLRGGTLFLLIFLTIINFTFDRNRWLSYVRISAGGFLIFFLALTAINNFMISNSKINIVTKELSAIDQVKKSANRTYNYSRGQFTDLDVHNFDYTSTKENSALNRFKLHEITLSNFFYAPVIKGSLYFLTPLPISISINKVDKYHKLSTVIYFIFFPFFLIGFFRILKNFKCEELYLLVFFVLCVALIIGAGPMILPRYRIMATPFYILIAMMGVSILSTRSRVLTICVCTLSLAFVIFYYKDLYNLIQLNI